MRWLVIGSGSIAQKHIDSVVLLDESAKFARFSSTGELPVLSGIDDVIEVVVDDWDEAIEWAPEAAIVANAASAHVYSVRQLVSSGIPTLVEKPLAVSADEARGLAESVRASGVPVLVGYCLRHHRDVKKMRGLVQSGELGELLQITAHVGQHIDDWRPLASRPPVSLDPGLGGGTLLELSHELDLVLSFLGKPRATTGAVTYSEGWKVEMAASILLSYGHSSAVISMNMLERPPRRQFGIIGSKGSAFADFVSGGVHVSSKSLGTRFLETSSSESMFTEQIRHFIACIRGQEQPQVSVEEAVSVLECIDFVRANEKDVSE